MAIKILYFASLREQLGCSEVSLPFQPGLKVSDVWAQANPGIVLPLNCLASVNQEYALMDIMVADHDEIAFFPPVTGG